MRDVGISETVFAVNTMVEQSHVRRDSSSLILVEHRPDYQLYSNRINNSLPIIMTFRTLDITPLQRWIRF